MKDLIATLTRLGEKQETRIDGLLEQLKEQLGDSFPEGAERLFESTEKELRDVRRLRSVFAGVLVLALLVSIGVAAWSTISASISDAQQALLDAIDRNQLIVRFDNLPGGYLAVVPDINAVSGPDSADASRLLREAGVLGRHPGFGRDRAVHLRRITGSPQEAVFAVEPWGGDLEQVVGRFTLLRQEGEFDSPGGYVAEGDVRVHRGLEDFWLKLAGYAHGGPSSSGPSWKLLFGEGQQNAQTWHPDTVYVQQSASGVVLRHVVLSDADWDGIYFVSVGGGNQGADTVNNQLHTAWNLRTIVTRYTPQR